MKKLSLFLLMLFFTSVLLFSQKDEVKVNFFDAEFFFMEEEYADALDAYKKVYNAGNQDNANINYRIGICYLNIEGEKSQAIPYLEKAVKSLTKDYSEGSFKEQNAPADALLYLGNAYRINKQIEKACFTYNEYINHLNDNDPKVVHFAQMQIDACQRARIAYQNPEEISLENLGPLYNSNLDNFNTVLSGDGTKMAFMSQQKFYDAVYYVQKVNGKWSNPVNITPQIQSDGDQYVTALSQDGTKMLLAKISNYDGDIMMSEYSSMRWSKSRNLGKPVNSKYFESHASFSPDGKTIYLTSNRPEGYGEMDIYTSQLDEFGKWSEPKNLGPSINTEFNEESPFLAADGKTLFFSSQGHSTIGGFDIFMSKMDENGQWNEPVALSYPANTADDDLFFYPLMDGSSGYITRFEPDGYGSGDIYLLNTKPEAEAEVAEIVEEEAIDNTSASTEPELIEEEVVNLADTELIKPEEILPEQTFHIKPIFFSFDSYQLSDMAKKKLKVIKQLFEEFPDLSLEVRGHTDAMGPVAYNQYLSEMRAKAVIDYLIDLGVDETKLKYKGYSENEPVAINTYDNGLDAKEGRQLNRRVEFKINIESQLIIVEPIVVPADLVINK
jgi:outer membrane protein OmpA-like peptidoglycan-associated protein